MENDQSYFSRRADQERSAAKQATNAKARAAHQAIAERYEKRLQSQGAH